MEEARAVTEPGLPKSDHWMVVEGWFDDVEPARTITTLLRVPTLDALATELHQRAGIRRCFSVVE